MYIYIRLIIILVWLDRKVSTIEYNLVIHGLVSHALGFGIIWEFISIYCLYIYLPFCGILFMEIEQDQNNISFFLLGFLVSLTIPIISGIICFKFSGVY